MQRLTYLDELDMDDRKKLSFFHVVPNSILTVKWWPEWASLIQAAYRGDLKSKSFLSDYVVIYVLIVDNF